MKSYWVDLHVHSALSPCAAEDMTPPAIVRAAIDRGLSMIAICDHNSAGNAAATQEAARNAAGLTVIAGIEMTTAEEVHIVGLFGNWAAAMATAGVIRATLPDATEESRRRFGEQRLLDAEGRLVGHEGKMLSAASTLTLAEAALLIRQYQGLAVAAHVNRPSYSVISQLGLFPRDVEFDAIEVFSPCGPASRRQSVKTSERQSAESAVGGASRIGEGWPALPVISSSDAHFVADIGRARSEALLEEPTFEELRLALRRVGGRSVASA